MTARRVGGTPLEPPPPSQHRLMRRALVLIALLCLLAPASSVASTASEGKRVIQDCASDGEVNGHYSQAAYKYALHHIPSDLAEYTKSRPVIVIHHYAAHTPTPGSLCHHHLFGKGDWQRSYGLNSKATGKISFGISLIKFLGKRVSWSFFLVNSR